MGSRLVAHDPSVGDYADTSPASLGRRTEELAIMKWRASSAGAGDWCSRDEHALASSS